MIEHWRPDLIAGCGPVPFRWPEPTIVHVDTTAMCRDHAVSPAGLWLRIRQGQIPEPVVWVDGKPGWAVR
ncbi:hypothetical protein ACFXHA_07785 [Nocardia sp. NPDC059240]|uniref:hypothetical protein n=1 Tax=Nocardia sp. NPDC059240 TaxID=3346786 RepID=UPI0036D09BD1